MIEDAFALALPDEEEFGSSSATAKMLMALAPPPERSGAAVADAWLAVDRAATFAAFAVFNQREDRVEPSEGGLGFTSGESQLPDEALARRMDPSRFRGELDGLYFKGKNTRLSAVLTLVDAHQDFYGPVAEAWEMLFHVHRQSPGLPQFARRVIGAMRQADAYGEDRELVQSQKHKVKSNPLGRGVRMLADFYALCAAADEGGEVEGERVVQQLLRLRFSRTLTAIEALWDILLTHGRSSLWGALNALVPPAPLNTSANAFAGGVRWISTPGGFRVAPHELNLPELERVLHLGSLQRYERRARLPAL